MRIFLMAAALLIGQFVCATNYYVDPSSTASLQNGLATSPWKSLTDLQNSITALQPGDVVYFKRGQVFAGSLNVKKSGTATAPITFSTYGNATDAAPIFTGSGEYMINISYQQYIVFDGLNISDTAMNELDHSVQANLKRAFNIDGSNYITIKNCLMEMVGTGVNVMGNYNTIQNCVIRNLRMIRNTPTTVNANDDYGASAVIVTGANNDILKNQFLECWANSYDYQFDGGGVEIYGAGTNNNRIMYNVANNCNGFMEVGSGNGGVSDNNLIAYNKFINCGDLIWINNAGTFAITVTNFKIYNNVLIETMLQFLRESKMIGMRTATTATGVFELKNNIFWLMTGVDVALANQFTAGQMIHENNIYRLGTNSLLNFTANTSELVATGAIFNNTSATDPMSWNVRPASGSPAINFGASVGLTQDFEGTVVSATPNAGIYQNLTGATSLAAAATITSAIACNGGTATVTVTASGGTAPYTGTGTFTVSAGTYNYTITDATGASKIASIVVTQPVAITTTATAGTITVNGGTTSITATASGGTSPFTYQLNTGTYQTSNVLTGVPAGTHTINIKDAKGCIKSVVLTIAQPAVLASTVTATAITCYGGNATVTVTGTGGTAPYSGVGTFVVPAGNYSYTVTDTYGNSVAKSITITQPALLNCTVTTGTITVAGATTTVTAAGTGGTGTLQYQLDAGAFQTSGSFTGVAAGSHTITLRDANGCTTVKSFSITQPSVLTISAVPGTISCAGGTTSVTVTASGGTAPYTGTGTFTSRTAGTYSFTVRDAANASASATIVISEPTAITATLTAGIIYGTTGTTNLSVSAAGGTGAYTYSLNNGTYQTSNSFANVGAGTHNVRIKDANGCILTKTITLTATTTLPLAIGLTSGTIACKSGSTTVTVSASGGVSPYTGTGTFTVTAGTYTYTVRDAAGNSTAGSITLTQPDPVSMTLTAGTIATNGGTTSVTVTASGGSGSFTYKLGTGAYQTSNVFSGLAAGTYSISTKDSRDCSSTKSITITQPPLPFKLTLAASTNVTCRNRNDGTITVTGANGYPPYTYKRAGGSYQASNVFSNLAAGTYTITGKDSLGNTSAVTVTILGSNKACTGKMNATADETESLFAVPESVSVDVFPNPAHDYFQIRLSATPAKPAQVSVYDASGKRIQSFTYEQGSPLRIGQSWKAGIYFLQITQNGITQNRKLIKL